MNDSERIDYVDNDEELYYWQRASGLSRRDFAKQHRAAIDAKIEQARKPPVKTWRDYR